MTQILRIVARRPADLALAHPAVTVDDVVAAVRRILEQPNQPMSARG